MKFASLPGRVAFTVLVCLGSATWGADEGRERLLMDRGWRFELGDAKDAGSQFDYFETPRLHKALPNDSQLEQKLATTRIAVEVVNAGADVSFVQANFDDSGWRKLDLPHDWAVELPFDKGGVSDHGYKALGPKWNTNIGWYRRSFELPAGDAGRMLSVEFDGVFRNSIVWLNGHCLGRNVSGYSGFDYDITKYARVGGKNELVVRVDATRAEGWFYEGAGIYRHVWLVKTAPIHVAHWGTYVTSEVKGSDADITIQTELRNDGAAAENASLISTIYDPAGKAVGEAKESGISLSAGEQKTMTQKVSLNNAAIWSPESPSLYKLVSSVKKDGAATDEYETSFGVRTIHFDPDKGFFLNGKRVQINGTCNHQDHAGVGTALPERLMAFRLEKLKKLGSNAYRMSHNPPAPELLDMCDRMGILVMDEHRKMGTSPEILSQLQRMIERDRNHPSIFIWSIGNEEMSIQGKDDVAIPVARTMQDLVHKLDPTRLATVAMNFDWGKGFSKVIDVQGFNYYHNGDNNMDKFHGDFPTKPCISTEEASTETTRGIYAQDKKNCYFPAYDTTIPKWGSTAESWMQYYKTRPYVAGAFVWTGFDYRGEPKPYGWPCINNAMGVMDTCGFWKDSAYFYKANWSDQPMLHLLPHWNWAGKEGKPINVWCYTNFEEVELFLNGKSLGRKPAQRDSHVEWDVPYEAGTLLARGYHGGAVAGEEKVETTGAPAAIKLIPDRQIINADGQDVSIVTVEVVDDQGRVVPIAKNGISFEARGATIIGVGNGNPSDLTPDKGTTRPVFNGYAQVIVKPTDHPGDGSFSLVAASAGLEKAEMNVKVSGGTPPAAVP